MTSWFARAVLATSLPGGARRARWTRPAASGFSLIEIVLVLAILVAMGAIVAPTMGEAFQRQKLQAAVQSLRSEWERARLTAMRNGQTQVFTCEPGTSNYSLQPYLAEGDIVNAAVGATVAVGGVLATPQLDGSVTFDATPAGGSVKQLDDDVLFVSCAVSTDMRAISVTQAQGGLTAQGALSQMVLFYPDGTTSTAEVVVQSPSGSARCVRMRGLTGHAQVHIVPNVAPATPGSVAAASGF
jgi:Tfp pilus assembly protein FimT